MNRVRVAKIQVTNLFGNINYDINLGENNPIAIITAPNGRGKTTMLNLVSFVLNPKYETFESIRRIPFDSFRCVLSNGKIVELKQTQNDSGEMSQKRAQTLRLIGEQAASRARMYFDNTDFEFCVYDNAHNMLHSFLYSEALRDAFGMDPSEYLDENDDDYPYYRGQRFNISMHLRYLWKMQAQFLEALNFGIVLNN